MAGPFGAADLDGGGAGVGGELGSAGESRWAAGASQDPSGQDGADAVHGGQCAAGGLDDLGHLGGVVLDPSVDGAYVGDQVSGELLAGPLHRADRTDGAQQGGGLVGGQLGRG